MTKNVEKYSYITQRDYEAVAGPSWPTFSQFSTHQGVENFVYAEIDDMLAPPKKFESSSFCILPFYGVEYPSNIACCLQPGGTSRELVKQEMLNGIRSSACNKCWRIEDAGGKSDRLIKNETLDFYSNTDIMQIYQKCVDGKNSIVHYKIDTSNVCNATCVTCSSFASSAWAKLEQLTGNTTNTWQKTPAEVDQAIDYPTAQSIGFRGGEPLLSKTNFHILEQLVKHNNTNCFISFTTNGSVALTARQQALISKFTSVNFCFSIDGLGPVFEYMRYPLKFVDIERNIQYCRDHSIIPSVSYTVSNVNVMYYNETIKWFEQQNLPYIVNPVYSPSYFAPSVLPEKVKQDIFQAGQTSELRELLFSAPCSDAHYALFRKKLAEQDQMKNIQLKYYLPELVKALDQ
jgi:sulfatase maturation enzyme AslB (radical SAM superfamily)